VIILWHILHLILMITLLSFFPFGSSPCSLLLSVFGLLGILTKVGGSGVGI
jgi:hypothetical protein